MGFLAMNTNSGKDHSFGIALALPATEEFSFLHLRRDLQSHPCLLQSPSRRLWPPAMAKEVGKGENSHQMAADFVFPSQRADTEQQLNLAKPGLKVQHILSEAEEFQQ